MMIEISYIRVIEDHLVPKSAQFGHLESTPDENRLRVDSKWVANFRLTRLTPTHSWTLVPNQIKSCVARQSFLVEDAK